MYTRLMSAIGLAALLILVLCTALAGQAASLISDYTLGTADGLALGLSAGGQVTSLQVAGTELVSVPALALLLRDLSNAGRVVTPNLLTNPGFEDGFAGWTLLVNGGLTVTLAVSPTHAGDQALAFSNPLTDPQPFAAYASDPVTVTAGQRYRVSAWWRSATGYVTHPNVTPTQWQMGLWQNPPHANGLYVQWLDAGGLPLGNSQLAVPLHWNAGHWRITRRELTAPATAAYARLIIGARVEADTLWVDDVAFIASPEPESAPAGVVAPCPDQGDCLKQVTTLSSGLVFTVTYTAHADHIAVYGEVADTTGQDRALDVTWGVPLDISPAKTWWDDAHTARPVTDTRTYANAISAIYDGWLPVSLYPDAGVQIASKGVALGLPLAYPQLALLSYDGATGRYGAAFHLGISPQALKLGPHATFHLTLYRFDPSWGFRDVIARHRAQQPAAYTTDLPVYNYNGRSQGQYYSPWGAQQVKADDTANVYSAQYTVGEFHLRTISDTLPRPDMDQIMRIVTDTLSDPNPRTQANVQALLASAVVDTNGDWSVKKLGSFPWSNGKWEMIWAANVDPDLTDGMASYMVDQLIDPAFTATEAIGAHLDGVQMDNFQATPAFDLRPEALAAADTTLGYTPHTYQPAVHTSFAFHEYLAFLRQHLDDTWGTDRGISINFWGLGNPNYLAPYLDAFGSEGSLKGNGEGTNWSPEILNYRRAIAYSRPYMFANQTVGLTAGAAYTASQLALLYGVAAGAGPNSADWEPEARQIVSDTAELVGRYWAAGWEPLAYARADSEDTWIERFGGGGQVASSSAQVGNLQPATLNLERYFTIHNRSDITRTAAITLETVPLGLTDPASALLTDMAITQTLPFVVVSGDIRFGLTLGPQQTRAVQVSGGVLPPTPTPTPVIQIYLPLLRK